MNPETLALYAHPVVGGAATLAIAYGASLGVRGRRAPTMRARHRALMPWVYGLVATTWAAGLTTVWALRDDLDLAASGHFSVGSAIIALLTAGALVSRRIPTHPWARLIHPWLGGAALLLSGVQVFLGLQIMPH